MKNYDDLQRFKEKTQTLDIAFKDMSGQTQEADRSQWAIIRQLAADEDQETLGGGQRIDLPQPQPIRGNEFSAPQAETQVTPVASSVRGSILDSLAAVPAAASAEPAPAQSLFPPETSRPAPSIMPVAPKATHVERQAATSLFPPPPPKPAEAPAAPVQAVVPEPVVAPAPRVVPAPVAPAPQPAAAAPSRFGALFRSRPAAPTSLSKDTPLKPLLEKIALCR
jgi:hypothetical protein